MWVRLGCGKNLETIMSEVVSTFEGGWSPIVIELLSVLKIVL